MNQPMDAWERASNPSTFGNEYWGKLTINPWLCALVKGQGKVPFDPQVHQKSATALDLEIIALPEMNITNEKILQRNIIAESSEWSKIAWASLKALGVQNLREAADRWVKAELVPTGDTYQKDGQTKERTIFKFVALFPDEAACRADYQAVNGAPTQASSPAAPAPAAQPVGGNDAEKAAAFQFAKVIVGNTMKACTGRPLDEAMNEVGKKLAEFPGVSKYFTVQSPEVMTLMMEAGK